MVLVDVVCGIIFVCFIIISDFNEGLIGDFCNFGNIFDDGEVEDYQVIIFSGLEVMAGVDVNVCIGGNVEFFVLVSGGIGVYIFEWSGGLGIGAS